MDRPEDDRSKRDHASTRPPCKRSEGLERVRRNSPRVTVRRVADVLRVSLRERFYFRSSRTAKTCAADKCNVVGDEAFWPNLGIWRGGLVVSGESSGYRF